MCLKKVFLTIIVSLGIMIGCQLPGIGSPVFASDTTKHPNVVVSIAPLHSIISAVMAEIDQPDLILPAGASPHAYRMQPSMANQIAEADLIFWIGPGLESFLTKPLETIGTKGLAVALSEQPGIKLLELRENENFEHHDHAEEGHGEEAHHDEDKHDHKHDEEAHHNEGEHEHDHDDGHEEQHDEQHADHDNHSKHGDSEVDPHLWLDPENAIAIAQLASAGLSELDPENAEKYDENFHAFEQSMKKLTEEVQRLLEPTKSSNYIVFHDAYQYFEKRFGLNVMASITLHPEAKPGARRVIEIGEIAKRHNATCLFSEPQFDPRIVNTIADEAGISAAVLDPLGVGLEPGLSLYPQLVRNLASSVAQCGNSSN